MPNILNKLTEHGIQSMFSATVYSKGLAYFLNEHVRDIQIDSPSTTECTIDATVKGSKSYHVFINIEGTNRIGLKCDCTCPMQFACKHIVATLLHAISQQTYEQLTKTPPREKDDPAIKHWLNQLQNAISATSTKPSVVDESLGLYYILSKQHAQSTQLTVELLLIRRLKAGGLGGQKAYSRTASSQQKHLHPIDKELIIKLNVASQSANQHHSYYNKMLLAGSLGETILPELLATGRCHWLSVQNPPLSQGPTKTAQLTWDIDPQGAQVLRFKDQDKTCSILFIDRSWYLDESFETIGLLETGLSTNLVKTLLSAPKIAPEHAKTVADFMKQHTAITQIKPPKQFTTKSLNNIKPVPCLRLFQASLQGNYGYYYYQTASTTKPLAALSFDYKGHAIPWSNKNESIHQVENDQITTLIRHAKLESKAVQILTQSNLTPISTHREYSNSNKELLDCFLMDEQADPLLFSTQVIPKLRQAGWQIEFDPDYPYQVIDEPIDDWYSSISEESSGYDWFGLELGITIKGEQINLLPVLQSLLKQIQKRNQMDIDDKDPIYAKLPSGQYIALPMDRIKSILNVLIELYDSDSLTDDQELRLSTVHAARLLDLEAAMGAAKMRWLGSDRILEMGRKIANFNGIQTATIPDQFLGKLRPYQQDGVNWLQFLREYEFGGVLADDMGLGKTVQTLAHITLEKTSGRMINPCLVIAPTSLMFNWQIEAKRFSPELKVLLLHGTDRHVRFDQMAEFDLILTTYPLIVRDKDILLDQHFHLLILDEAQCIKNAKSQAAQIAIQIKATHRLCLTGTPMENHLGELWSLFHFMMPGLLGDQKTFTRLFRTPIEKHGNQERRLHLNRRIAPFLLRRTKNNVVEELPEKVEIIRHIELDGNQRDLYETIRVTMQEKIRKEIAKLGLARSHIIILDALLKLRQVCCDPRLLKINTTKKKASKSAKLDLLMTLIPELITEGRRILLFSQFTEMLGLIEEALSSKNIPYVKLTGQTKDRATPIQQFQNGEFPLFLISLKAGGTGLNLTAADAIIHYDPWWNPAVENQATDRAHRIGQNKTVFVYKLVVKGTVEEKILEMQQRKKALMDSLFSDSSIGKSALTEHDLKDLFEPLE